VNEEEKILVLGSKENPSLTKSEQLFDSIIGYNDIKRLFNLSFSSEKPVHILLVGPPASAKTLFMLSCMKLERSYFTLGSHSTKSGMMDYLFQKRPRYLVIDEIEHMPIKDQTALLSLMETGIIVETKYKKTRDTQQYKYEAFQEVAIHLLSREGISREIAIATAETVWSKMKSKDIRDCVKIGHLAKTKDDVDWIAETLKNYK
jgi:Holliday junction DNA helicase RuvB